MTRLLFVVNDAPFFLSHRLPVAVAARDAGYDVHVATPPSERVARVEDAGLAWHPIRLSRAGRNPLGEAAAVRDLRRLYRALRPDVVHHVTPKPVLYGTVAARLARVPAVVNAISGMGHVFAQRAGVRTAALRAVVSGGYRLALRHPRMRVIFQNVDARADFLRRGWVRPHEAVLVRGSGVDVTAFAPPSARAPGPPLVVLVARLLWTKGVGEFVDAAARLRAQGVAARFALVGDPDPGNPASIPEATLREWAARGDVELWGRRDDVAAVLAEAHVACLPSYLEGLPKSLIEAAASGLPIVATDVPGCREVVAPGQNGLLVPPNAVEPLAEALRALVEDPARRERYGAVGRSRAVAEFSLDGVVAAHLALYRELAG